MNEPSAAADSAQPDPELAAILRASSEQRIAAQIQAARQQAAAKQADRAAFTQNRNAGLRARHATKAARLGLIQFHDAKETTVTTRKFNTGDQVGIRTIPGASGTVEQVLGDAEITIYWVAYGVEQGEPEKRGFYTADQLMDDEELWQQEVSCWGAGDSATVDRDQVAQKAAEYIANVLTPQNEKTISLPGVSVHYLDGKRPPTDVADIKAALLDGRLWISWTCDRVTAAMRALHGEPADLS
jgi:hypothetical protein